MQLVPPPHPCGRLLFAGWFLFSYWFLGSCRFSCKDFFTFFTPTIFFPCLCSWPAAPSSALNCIPCLLSPQTLAYTPSLTLCTTISAPLLGIPLCTTFLCTPFFAPLISPSPQPLLCSPHLIWFFVAVLIFFTQSLFFMARWRVYSVQGPCVRVRHQHHSQVLSRFLFMNLMNLCVWCL